MTVIISEQVSAESARDPPVPADRTPAVLGGMDDLQLLAIPAEDLTQAGYVGLMKAINNSDPFGRSLAAYAQPCVAGEIKPHFRDTRWQIHVKRPAKELAMEVRAVIGQLTQELRRTPYELDLARYLGASAANLREARLAELAFRPSPLDQPLSGQPGAAGGITEPGNRSFRSSVAAGMCFAGQ